MPFMDPKALDGLLEDLVRRVLVVFHNRCSLDGATSCDASTIFSIDLGKYKWRILRAIFREATRELRPALLYASDPQAELSSYRLLPRKKSVRTSDNPAITAMPAPTTRAGIPSRVTSSLTRRPLMRQLAPYTPTPRMIKETR